MSLKTLFSLEWIKLQSTRTLIFFLVYLLMACGITLLILGIVGLPPKEGKYLISIADINPFGMLLATFSGNLAIIASLFFIMQTADEYKYGMMKKNIIDGMSRNDVFNGKMIFLFGSYTAWTIIFLVVFMLAGSIRLSDHAGEFIASIKFTQVIKFLIYLFFYGSLSHFLVTATRSSTISILILLGVAFAEPISIMALRYYELDTIATYLPFELASAVRTEDLVSNTKIAVFVGYLLTFLGLSQYINIKRDL